jgi:hypothetical protein
MRSAVRPLLILALMSAAVVGQAHATDRAGRKAFQAAWVGQSVVVKRVLYSVVFDERQRALPIVKRRDRVTGLTVATPTGTSYYQFEARRDSEKDIVAHEPEGVVSQMRDQYLRSRHLDTGAAHDVEPVMLVQYAPGAALVVGKVQIDRDSVRLYLYMDGAADLATTLTIKFPLPLSKELSEAALIEDAIGQFVARQ